VTTAPPFGTGQPEGPPGTPPASGADLGASMPTVGPVKVPSFVLCVGRKGSGKSQLAQVLWLSYRGDRLCIDPTGDVAQALGGMKGTRVIHGGYAPTRWPRYEDEGRCTIIYVPVRKANPSWRKQVDSWIGLADYQGGVCIWVDEVGLITKAQNCPDSYGDCLQTGRHRGTSLVQCCPRPKDIDPLVPGQADYIYVFDLPQIADKQRIAEIGGYPTSLIEAGVQALGPYEHLRLDTTAPSGSPERLMHMEALPLAA
jgi:hypothetical protein